ncbi:MAG: NUDIX domain-containing protein [Pseudomonadales bacterium]|nr:NUDIX domain-containing protein [Pseudomonadales bacterium]NRA17415.1 NUDIX domain-containing protein [Oceanospirillaceae bacterium]
MRLLKSTVHSDIKDLSGPCFKRDAARAIVLRGQQILLLHTQRYDDYSLPGGGIDEGEQPINGLIRELQEETGAQNISNIVEFGCYEEYRPWYKDNLQIVHMRSFCYRCTIDEQLQPPNFEPHEIANGMTPGWIDIQRAIAHNQYTLVHSEKQGLSIVRETFLLQLIVKELLS